MHRLEKNILHHAKKRKQQRKLQDPLVTFWARKCDITGQGMNEGFCIEDGMMYIKYDKDMIQHLRQIDKDEQIKTDEDLYVEYYENDYYYWTEWEDDEQEHQYKEINGKLIEI